MHAETLRDFFVGTATRVELARDLRGAFESNGNGARRLRLANLEGEFVVTAAHLVALLDAALANAIPLADLEGAGAALAKSGAFLWDARTPDGAGVATVVRQLATPTGGTAVTRATVAAMRRQLIHGP